MSKERTIISYFPSSETAETAVQALKQAGFEDAHVRRTSRYGISLDMERTNTVAGQARTLTGLTLFSADTSNDDNHIARILMAADPSVSGMSARGYGTPGAHGFSLIAFAPDEQVDDVVSIIKENGGEV